MMSEDINGFLCLKLNLHVKLATIHGKKARVKRNQYEKATVCLNMLRSAHLTRCTLSREEFQFKMPKMATHNSISLFTNLFCKPKMAVKYTHTKTSTNRSKNAFNIPQDSWPSLVENDK